MVLASVLLPLSRCLAAAKVAGTEHLATLKGPVILAANHQSYLDTPVILASLPSHPDRHSLERV